MRLRGLYRPAEMLATKLDVLKIYHRHQKNLLILREGKHDTGISIKLKSGKKFGTAETGEKQRIFSVVLKTSPQASNDRESALPLDKKLQNTSFTHNCAFRFIQLLFRRVLGAKFLCPIQHEVRSAINAGGYIFSSSL